MTLLHFPAARLHPPLSFRRRISAAAASSSQPPHSVSRSLPARDRTVDFGKHKGRMLGTLPSKYLLWVSRNLRAGDFEEWARLADEVLRDPVYRDRMEWESAERLLTGEGRRNHRSESPVADLLEVGDRFGWDTQDKAGWGRVDFGLLGTSRGGRIPRIRETTLPKMGGDVQKKDGIFGGDLKGGKVGFLSNGARYCLEGKECDEEEEVRGKMEERRERRRMRKEEQMQRMKREGGVEDGGGGYVKGRKEVVNPFPGRGALLEKMKMRHGD